MDIYLTLWLVSAWAISITIWYVIDRVHDRKLKRYVLYLEQEVGTKTRLASTYRKKITELENEIDTLKTQRPTEEVPFDDYHECKYCHSTDFRETECYYICNECNRRERK